MRALAGRAAWRDFFLGSLRQPGLRSGVSRGAPDPQKSARARARVLVGEGGCSGAVASAGKHHVKPAAVQNTVIERSAAAIEATTIHGAAAPKPPSGASVPRAISRPCSSSSSALVAPTPHADMHAAWLGVGVGVGVGVAVRVGVEVRVRVRVGVRVRVKGQG